MAHVAHITLGNMVQSQKAVQVQEIDKEDSLLKTLNCQDLILSAIIKGVFFPQSNLQKIFHSRPEFVSQNQDALVYV